MYILEHMFLLTVQKIDLAIQVFYLAEITVRGIEFFFLGIREFLISDCTDFTSYPGFDRSYFTFFFYFEEQFY